MQDGVRHSTNPNQALHAQQLMHIKEGQTDILIIFDSPCCRHSLKSPVWITEWERTLHRAVGRAINNDKQSGLALNTVIDDIFVQVSRAIERGDSRPAGFDFLLQVLSRQFDNGNATSALSELLVSACTAVPLTPITTPLFGWLFRGIRAARAR